MDFFSLGFWAWLGYLAAASLIWTIILAILIGIVLYYERDH